MNKVLNKDYSLAYTSFIANGIKYRLSGTKCEDWEKINLCEDCWKDENGKFHTIVREMLMVRQKEKKIEPIEESKVILNTETKKKMTRNV